MSVFDGGAFDSGAFAVSSQGDYTQLLFNNVVVDQTSSTATVSTNFLCPFCSGRPQRQLSSAVLIPQSVDLNINRLVSFTLPCCGKKVSLWVAVHKTKDVNDLQVCVQKTSEEGATGIPLNWWVKSVG
jgi:hypothetical protein